MKKVLYIGIDGCRPDSLEVANTPNIDKLIKTGFYSNNSITCVNSNSGSCWASLLTGVWEDKHGVMDNSCVGSQLHNYQTIFQRLFENTNSFKSCAIVNWTTRHHPIMEGVSAYHLEATDRAVCERACRFIEDESADLLYLLFNDVDTAGHQSFFSPDSAGYLESIENTDKLVGQLMESFEAHRSTESDMDWLIVIVTDHGGIGKNHGGDSLEERQIFLIFNDPLKKLQPHQISSSSAVDVPVTILDYFGINIDTEWKVDGQSLFDFSNQ